ncbi:MAG TPA: CHASE domain-containing protein [Polyangia bacterium]|nr:CHASE domain-containing protein [Polyangia bacterium]
MSGFDATASGVRRAVTPPVPAVVGPHRSIGWRRVLPFAVAGVLMLSTVGAVFALARAQDDRDTERFRREVQVTQDRIVGRLDTYVNILLAARALFSVVDPGDPSALRRWIDNLDIQHRHPGVQSIGYLQAVSAGDRERVVGALRGGDQVAAGFHIWPGADNDAACAVTFVDPPATNKAILGFDMCSETIRRAAILEARDTGMATASDRVKPTLAKADQRQGGFLLFVAIYRGGGVPPSVQQRRQDLLGFVYTRFRSQDLFQGLFHADEDRGLALRIDDREGLAGQPLFASDPGDDDPGRGTRLAMSVTVPVAGRNWEMRFGSLPALDAPYPRRLAVTLLLAGMVISLVVALVVRAQQRGRLTAENSEAWTHFLSDTAEQLGSSLESVALAEAMARFSVPMLGDWCTIDLIDPDNDQEQPTRAILAHADPAQADLAEKLRAYPPRGQASPVVRQAVAERCGVRNEITDQLIATVALDDQHQALMKQMGVRAALVVPLIARGRVLGWMTVARVPAYSVQDLALMEDLGRRAAMALDNARLYAQAQEAVSLRDSFVSVASHELKAPLTTLRLQSQSMLRAIERGGVEASDQSRAAYRVTVIEQQTVRLAKMIDDLMDISRISAGRMSFDVEDVDLGEVVQEVVERLEDESAKLGTAVEVSVPSAIIGRWDRARLDQVLTNLLSNAIKYGAQRPVSLSAESTEGLARVSVRDQGIGIAPESQGRIFQRFERVVSERRYGGFGLGLWITRQIVEAQGGRVTVKSMPGQGSTFVVELPTGR